MIPLRLLFRNRWWALAWSACICWSALSFVGEHGSAGQINAAQSADTNLSQQAALAAEDQD